MNTVPIAKGDGLTTFILTIVMLVICLPTVALRFWVRIKIKALGLDDWLMGVGMVGNFAGLFIAFLTSSRQWWSHGVAF